MTALENGGDDGVQTAGRLDRTAEGQCADDKGDGEHHGLHAAAVQEGIHHFVSTGELYAVYHLTENVTQWISLGQSEAEADDRAAQHTGNGGHLKDDHEDDGQGSDKDEGCNIEAGL